MKRYYKPNRGHGDALDETMTIKELIEYFSSFNNKDVPVVAAFEGMSGPITAADFGMIYPEEGSAFLEPTLVMFDTEL
jgi:hypothetical protein